MNQYHPHKRPLPTMPLAVAMIGLLVTIESVLADWPGFHGGDQQGIVSAGTLPTTWTENDYEWQVKLSGRDIGSPSVHGGTVYVLDHDVESDMIHLVALSLQTGEELWSRGYPQSDYHTHNRNSLAASTPACDDENVYVAFSDGDHTMLIAMTHDGKERWTRDFGRWQSQHGFGTSPRLVGDMVVLMYSQQGEELPDGVPPGVSRMIAVNRTTGDTTWETPLTTTRACYGVPAVHTTRDGSVWLIGANTGDGLFAIDAKSGKMVFRSEVFRKRSCSSPIVFGNTAIGSCGSGGGGNQIAAIELPTLVGDVSVDSEKRTENNPPPTLVAEKYRITSGAPYVPTPVVSNGILYAIDDRGIASGFDAETGKDLFRRRIGGNFSASPLLIGSRMLIVDLRGQASVLDTTNELEVLGKIELGGDVGATPAYSNGKLILRIDDRLACLKCL